MNFQIYNTSPVALIADPEIDKYGVKLYLKREDLLHPLLSGNKWRKLKYNLIQARIENKLTLLSFGGAYSNHIYSLAAAGKIFGFKTIGIIRGEETYPLNPTLTFAQSNGMHIFYETREAYREKETQEYRRNLHQKFGDFYLIPEGGTNQYALKGVQEIIPEININFDVICCPCGSGGTIAGLIQSSRQGRVLGICVLKGAGMLDDKVNSMVGPIDGKNWAINYDYHFGGYAKMDRELIRFIQEFENRHAITLEPIYTGKMMFALYDLIKKGNFKKGESIIALHTGGLQALEGLISRIKKITGK